MKFEKKHRREHTEPQLAAMIDVFSILIIFLIAGTTMDSSILNIPADLFLAETSSKSSSINAPQATLKDGILVINFINEEVAITEIENESIKIKNIGVKLKDYLTKVEKDNKKKNTQLQLLQSINLLADKSTPYKDIFTTMKYFRGYGFQNTILVGVEKGGRQSD